MANDFPEERGVTRRDTPSSGLLYLVATPIGNLDDLGMRAVRILKAVDVIACEDTRHSRSLLDHHGIDRPLFALHEHNEDQATARLLERLRGGAEVALISDAGTPLINDPGYPLVRQARLDGIRVAPVPGPCALIAALAASGLPCHRFTFEGFPPRRRQARRTWLESLRDETRTMVFYEASHRIRETLEDMAGVFPVDRPVVIARELTKRFESIVSLRVGEAAALLDAEPDMRLGEFVVVLEGARERKDARELSAGQRHTLEILLREHSLSKAVELTVRISGARRELVYREALHRTGLDTG